MAETKEIRLDIQGPTTSWTFVVPEGTSRIGREATNEVCLPHPLVSRKHAVISREGMQCTLEDSKSANGTVLNNAVLPPNTPTPLEDQAKIVIGPFVISFSIVTVPVEEEQAPPQETTITPAPKEAPPKTKPTPPPKEAPVKAKVKPAAKEEPPEPIKEVIIEEKEEKPWSLPPGLAYESMHFLDYMPGIYHTDFMSRFLALFEYFFVPLEWTVENFDLYLDPNASPYDFLPWLANWYEIYFDSTWSEAQRRTLLEQAPKIYSLRGTRWSLSQILEIYTGSKPEIIEFEEGLDPYAFKIKLPVSEKAFNRNLIEQIVDLNKPVHTTYMLEFTGSD